VDVGHPTAKGIEPFTVLVRVGESGEVEEVLTWPDTRVAQHLKAEFPATGHGSKVVIYVLTCRDKKGYEKSLGLFMEMVAKSKPVNLRRDEHAARTVSPALSGLRN
jgi:hypothetical protein